MYLIQNCSEGNFWKKYLNGSLVQFKIAAELDVSNLVSPSLFHMSYISYLQVVGYGFMLNQLAR